MKGLIVHPVVSEHLCGIFGSSHRVPKVPNGIPLQERVGRGSILSISIIPPLSPFNEGLGLKILILDS